jgi:hypothetical protein
VASPRTVLREFWPNDFHDLRTEAIQHLTDLAEDLGKDPETFGAKIRIYRGAARLLKSGRTPPAHLVPNTWTRTIEDPAPEEPH